VIFPLSYYFKTFFIFLHKLFVFQKKKQKLNFGRLKINFKLSQNHPGFLSPILLSLSPWRLWREHLTGHLVVSGSCHFSHENKHFPLPFLLSSGGQAAAVLLDHHPIFLDATDPRTFVLRLGKQAWIWLEERGRWVEERISEQTKP
jgi:hypothetical protein